MHCYFCDQTSPEGSLFCKPCGSPFHLAPCPNCAAVNALVETKCYKCAATLDVKTIAGIGAVCTDADKDSDAYLDTVPFAMSVVAEAPAELILPHQTSEENALVVAASASAARDVMAANRSFDIAPNVSPDVSSDVSSMPLHDFHTIDLVQRARWGQRAVMSSLVLIVVIATAYFYLRSRQSTGTLEQLPTSAAPPVSTTQSPEPPSASPVNAPTGMQSKSLDATLPISSAPTPQSPPLMPPTENAMSTAAPSGSRAAASTPAPTSARSPTSATIPTSAPIAVKRAAPLPLQLPRIDPDAAATAAAIAAALGPAAKVAPDAVSPNAPATP